MLTSDTDKATITTGNGTHITLSGGRLIVIDEDALTEGLIRANSVKSEESLRFLLIIVEHDGAEVMYSDGSSETIPSNSSILVNPDGSVNITESVDDGDGTTPPDSNSGGGGGCNAWGTGAVAFMALVMPLLIKLRRRK